MTAVRCREWLGTRGFVALPRRVLMTLPRSGTHWLKRMICSVLGRKPLEVELHQQTPAADLSYCLRLPGEPGMRLVYGHFDFARHAAVLDPSVRRLRMVLLIRHPLDALISQYHKSAADGRLPDPSADVFANIRRCLRDPSASHAGALRRQCLDWIRAGRCGVIRYEDLVADPAAGLAAALDQLGVPWNAARIARAVSENQFRALSGGRRPGDEDPAHHYRRGLPGEWRRVLSPDDIRAARDHMGAEIAELGYSLD